MVQVYGGKGGADHGFPGGYCISVSRASASPCWWWLGSLCLEQADAKSGKKTKRAGRSLSPMRKSLSSTLNNLSKPDQLRTLRSLACASACAPGIRKDCRFDTHHQGGKLQQLILMCTLSVSLFLACPVAIQTHTYSLRRARTYADAFAHTHTLCRAHTHTH